MRAALYLTGYKILGHLCTRSKHIKVKKLQLHADLLLQFLKTFFLSFILFFFVVVHRSSSSVLLCVCFWSNKCTVPHKRI